MDSISSLVADQIESLGQPGVTREEFGPGIVVRHRDGVWGTLRRAWEDKADCHHIEHRGSDERDFGAPLINVQMLIIDVLPNPYEFEEIGPL